MNVPELPESLELPELVVFDCDGVLVDSEPIANRVLTEHLRRQGLTFTQAEVEQRFVGRSLADCLAEIERLLARPLPDDFAEALERETYAAFRGSLRPVAGVKAVLEEVLYTLDLPVCVASSGAPEKIRGNLALTGLLPYFGERLFSAVEVARGKPAPDLFLHAAEALGADPARCAVVEDSTPGVDAGLAAGMRVYAFGARHAGRRGVVAFEDMAALPHLLAGGCSVVAPGGSTRRR